MQSLYRGDKEEEGLHGMEVFAERSLMGTSHNSGKYTTDRSGRWGTLVFCECRFVLRTVERHLQHIVQIAQYIHTANGWFVPC